MNELSFSAQMRKKLEKFQDDLYKHGNMTYMGHPDGVTVSVVNRPGWVYASTENSQPVEVFNKRAPLVWGLPIIVGTTPEEPWLLQVISFATTSSYSTSTVNFGVGPHAQNHAFLGSDPVFIDKRQLLPAWVGPGTAYSGSAVSGSAAVQIYPDVVYVDGAWVSIPFQTVNLNSYIPASGSSVYVLLSIAAGGSIVITPGTTVTGNTPNISVAGVLPPLPARHLALAFVRLWGGMAQVVESVSYTDILDARSLLVVGSSGIPSPTALGKTLVSSGSPLQWTEDNTYYSAGIYTPPTITALPDGSMGIGPGVYAMYADNTFNTPLTTFALAGGSYTFTDMAINYVYVSGSGTPSIVVSTSRDAINQSNVVPIVTVFREGTELHWIGWDTMAKGMGNKLSDRLVRTERFKPESGGLLLGEVATRTITTTSGVVWYGAANTVMGAFTSATDECDLWYSASGSWVKTTITQYNNSQYNGPAGLVSTSSNRYVVNWVFRGIETVKHGFVVLGTADYKLNDAQASTVPSLPPIISSQCILVGRIIVKQGDSTATEIASAFTENLAFTPITDHNSLLGLQGGTTNEYYHLTNAQHAALATAASGSGVPGRVAQWGTATNLTSANLIGPAANVLTLEASGSHVLTVTASGSPALVNVANVFTQVNTFGGMRVAVAVKTSDYTLTENDFVVVFAASGSTVPSAIAPAATGTGQTYRICNEGTANVTVDGNGGTIKGQATQTLYPGEDIIITDYAVSKWS